MGNYPSPPTPTNPIPVALGGAAGLWCPRKECQRRHHCHYTHNCKAMTPEVAAAKQAQWEIDKKRREEIAEKEARVEELRRESRKRRIGVMLAAYDLSIEDLEAWVKDVQNGR